MKKVIEYKGKKLEIIARECYDMAEPYYEYWVREIIEKKHWWSSSRLEIIHGQTFWWGENRIFEERIMEFIKEHYNKKDKKNAFQKSVKKFFNNDKGD